MSPHCHLAGGRDSAEQQGGKVFLRALCVAVVLFVATSGRSGEPRTIGPDACATCHSTQHSEWTGHSHASAFTKLPVKARSNPLCLTCHAPDPQRREAGVTCESCHGAGSEYSEGHLMRDKYLRGFLGLKKVELATCKTCHQNDHSTKLRPIDLAALWNKLHHRRATEEAPSESSSAPSP